jgi:hypothetical protein
MGGQAAGENIYEAAGVWLQAPDAGAYWGAM